MENNDKKIYLIARVSDTEQRKALPAQKLRLVEYATKKHLKYEYCEFDESAYKDDRRKFSELVEKISSERNGLIVVFDKIDRFTRDASQREVRLFNGMVSKGLLEMHFPSDNLYITKDSPASDLFRLGIGMLLGKYYSDASRDNVKRRFAQMLNDGEWVHRAPIGYKNTNTGTADKPIKEIVVDENYAHYIVKAFELRAQGMPYSLIAKQLIGSGYVSRQSGKPKLSKGSVQGIIDNKFYYGVMTQNGKEYPHKYQPLIDRALYNQCQRIKDDRKAMKTKWDSLDFTLKDIVKCGRCGHSVSPFNNRKWVYLKCANKNQCGNPNTAESLVLGSVEAVLQKITIPREIIDKVINELKSKHDDQQLYFAQSISKIRNEYDDITRKLDSHYENLLDRRITPEQHDRIANMLTGRQSELNNRLNILTNGNKDFHVTTSYLLDLANRAEELFNCSDEGMRSQLLGYLLSNIQLNDKKLSFEVNYPFNLMLEEKENAPEGAKIPVWCGLGDSNSWPLPWQGSALTTELNPHDCLI